LGTKNQEGTKFHQKSDIYLSIRNNIKHKQVHKFFLYQEVHRRPFWSKNE